MYKVYIIEFEQLTEQEKDSVSNNGCGKEDANYIAIDNGEDPRIIHSDAMEREDAKFTRNLKWIVDALNEAHESGVEEGYQKGYNDGYDSGIATMLDYE